MTPVTPLTPDPLWYKDAIIYEVHVRAFQDSNGDGIGDFPGLTSRLDYLEQLGINAIWLLPFYPSPLRDGGYDIADYTSINPDYGTMRDFTRFVREAHRRGMRVITELVVNHTSDQHPWFQRARTSPPGSAARDWYVWSDTDTRYSGTRIIFTDTETSNWAWDPVGGQYYWHRFFSHQPDLNYDNPQVRRAIVRVMQFWFDKGVDGMRLDAVPYLVEREGTNNENLPETHEVIKEWRAFVDQHYADKMLLAEANQWPDDVRAYFGDGDECHMAYHFPVMPRLFMGLRQEDRRPIVDILARTPPIPETCQWALFLRNHDELTLEMVTDEERDYMYSIYAADPRMRVNVGIRRRFAPLLDNNRRAIELLNALLFSLPGTPIIYYGDELGMGDNVFLGDRDGVRTPMQWNGDRNAGFSRADPASLYLPVVQDPLYGYQAVNVDAQERSASSLLNWMRRMIALRSRRQAMGRGDLVMLHPENRAVLAFLRIDHGAGPDAIPTLVVANLSRFAQPVELDLGEYVDRIPVEVIGQRSFPRVGDGPYVLMLGPHSFYWFDLVPAPVEERVEVEEAGPAVVVAGGDWRHLLAGDAREQLEREVLPAYLERQRWFAGTRPERVRVHSSVLLVDGAAAPAWLTLVDAEREGEVQTYALALGVTSGRGRRQLQERHPDAAIAEVRSERGTGLLYEATASEHVVQEILGLLAGGRTVEGDGSRLVPATYGPFRAHYDALEDPPTVTRNTGEQSNTSVRVDQHFMLKLLRRFEPEPHPETEIGRHLAEAPGPAARLLGDLVLEGERGRGPVLVAHEFAWSRGGGWDLMVAACLHFLDEHGADEAPALSNAPPLLAARDELREAATAGALASTVTASANGAYGPPVYAEQVAPLGRATADLHRVLAESRGDEAFEPEPLTAADLDALAGRSRQRLRGLRRWLRDTTRGEDARQAQQASAVLEAEEALTAWLAEAPRAAGVMERIRVHGDYHLGQVLDVDGRFVILDFEGEVGLPIEERRRKAPAFVDVAGMMRSFSYAALTARASRLLSLPEGEAPFERIAAWASWWEERAVISFLAAYLEEAAGAPFLPDPGDEGQRVLDLYVLDKVLHELEYEIAYRPEWTGIPLEGLAQVATRIAGRVGTAR